MSGRGRGRGRGRGGRGGAGRGGGGGGTQRRRGATVSEVQANRAKANLLKRKEKFIESRESWSKPKRTKHRNDVILNESDYFSNLFDSRAQQHADQCIGRLVEQLESKGLSQGRISHVILVCMDPCLKLIMECTNEYINLNKLSDPKLEYYEMVQFVALVHYSHYTNWSFEITIKQWSERGYAVLDIDRLRWIQQNMKIYSATGRGDSGTTTWNSQRDQTVQLDDFEAACFKTLKKVFVSSENMVATLDDETYGCRAADNQVKTLNNRKADREGYSAYVLADCYFRAPLGMRLRHLGESQEDNVNALINNTFKSSGTESKGTSLLGADRGYASVPTAENLSQKGFGVILIHPDHYINNHPFCSDSKYNATGFQNVPQFEEEAKKKLADHATKFLVDDSPNLGFDAMMSTKKIQGTQKKVTAVALRERGDSKNSKILLFSHTELKGNIAESNHLNAYIGVRYSHGRSKKFRLSHLFTVDPRSSVIGGSPDLSLRSGDKPVNPRVLAQLRRDARSTTVYHFGQEVKVPEAFTPSPSSTQLTSPEQEGPSRRITLTPSSQSHQRLSPGEHPVHEIDVDSKPSASKGSGEDDSDDDKTSGRARLQVEARRSRRDARVSITPKNGDAANLSSPSSTKTSPLSTVSSKSIASDSDDESVESCSSALELGIVGDANDSDGKIDSRYWSDESDDESLSQVEESQDSNVATGMEKHNEAHDLEELEVKESKKATPLTQSQRDQTWHNQKKFRLTGTMSNVIFINSPFTRGYIIKGADPNGGKEFTPAEMFELLMKSWFSFNVLTEAMKRGQVNEEPVMNSLEGVKGLNLEAAFECGLFYRNGKPWFAVSPDGVLLFRYDDGTSVLNAVLATDAQRKEILASLEIKSGISVTGSIMAIDNARLEPYECLFGDRDFFELTTKEHRAQLLMQAYVLDVRKVLYVRATESGLQTIVLVNFTDEKVANAEKALATHEATIRWLHEQPNGPDKISFPLWLPEDSRKTIESHWWFWNLLRNKAKDGALLPICVFRNGVQVLYNKAKTGVDGVTQSTNLFRSQSSKLKWEQNVGTKSMRRVFHGSFIAYRLLGAKTCITPQKYEGLAKLRGELNKYMSMGEFLDGATCDLLSKAQELSGGRALPTRNSIVALAPGVAREYDANALAEMKEQARKTSTKKKELFNEEPRRSVRLDRSLGHFPVGYPMSGKNCAMCGGGRHSTECFVCGVILCCANEENSSCFVAWHTHEHLE